MPDKQQPTPKKKCACGCGAAVRATYLPGHDAKHKSRLIKAALGTGKRAHAAEAVLAERNWTHFLDRKREILAEQAARAAKPGKEES